MFLYLYCCLHGVLPILFHSRIEGMGLKWTYFHETEMCILQRITHLLLDLCSDVVVEWLERV